MLQVKQKLNQRYQLQQQLGQNAGRQTWLAKDLQSEQNELVVVKLLAFSPQMQWEELKLFEREAQVLKHLTHPKIPRYRDYFAIDESEFDLPWFCLVQQYIQGCSLRQLLDQGKRFTESEAKQIATEVLNILIYLHELSPTVLHRDIKPSNLILGEDEQVYLVDFGAVQERAKAEGATFTVVGTSGYAAPEQLWGRTVPASDLYSLGATLIHLLTGIAPADLPQQNFHLQFTNKTNLNPHFSYWLQKLIDPATEQRFSNANQALEALEAAFISDDSKETNQPINRVLIFSSFIVLILILAAGIGIPVLMMKSLNSQAIKAKQAEAKQYVGSMNRAQQAYFLEKDTFAHSIQELGIGIKSKTDNYTYSIHLSTTDKRIQRVTPSPVSPKLSSAKEVKPLSVTSTALKSNQAVLIYGLARHDNLKSYVGYVVLIQPPNESGLTTYTIICEADVPGRIYPTTPSYIDNQLVCGAGTHDISK